MSAKPEPPREAVTRLFDKELRDGYELVGCHRYNATDGTELFRQVRLKHPDKPKIIRPMHLNGTRYRRGRPQRPTGGWPLYTPPFPLVATDPVYFVEGETCADALAELGITAFTSGGAASADAVDWTPVQGVPAVIWPDNDSPGALHAQAVMRNVPGARLIHRDIVAALPHKCDCVDWLALHTHATATDVRALPLEEPPGRNIESGATILDAMHDYLGRFVAYPSEQAHVAHTLWIAHTHCMEAWDTTPRIAFLSPEPGSGKSRALEVSELLVPRPVEAVNVSPAYLFRKVGTEDGRPTILYDEIDTVFGPKARENEELRGLLNAGHRRHSAAGRCVVRGKEVFTEELPAYCAVALAGLGDLPDTIITRSVVVRMRRRAPGEVIEPYRRRIELARGQDLHDRMATWAESICDDLGENWPNMPRGIADRDADVWEALLAIADAAGGDWPTRARVAAVALVAESKRSTPSLGVQLLADIRRVFADADALATEVILNALNKLEDSPWGDLHGKPLDSRGLSRLLRPYGIAPQVVRIEKSTPRGYRRDALHDAWQRYLPLQVAESATSATSATSQVSQGASRCGDVSDTRRTCNGTATEKPRSGAMVADVADVAVSRAPDRQDTADSTVAFGP